MAPPQQCHITRLRILACQITSVEPLATQVIMTETGGRLLWFVPVTNKYIAPTHQQFTLFTRRNILICGIDNAHGYTRQWCTHATSYPWTDIGVAQIHTSFGHA